MSDLHLLDNRFDLTPPDAFAGDLFGEPADRPIPPVRVIEVTDEMRQRDAEQRLAREQQQQRKPPIRVKPRPTERELDAYWNGLDPQEKYWLVEAAAAEFRRQA